MTELEDITPTTILVCPKCNKEFLPCFFRHTKCSENFCGAYYVFMCPTCYCKVIPKETEGK